MGFFWAKARVQNHLCPMAESACSIYFLCLFCVFFSCLFLFPVPHPPNRHENNRVPFSGGGLLAPGGSYSLCAHHIETSYAMFRYLRWVRVLDVRYRGYNPHGVSIISARSFYPITVNIARNAPGKIEAPFRCFAHLFGQWVVFGCYKLRWGRRKDSKFNYGCG